MEVTEISERTVRRTLATWQQTGQVTRKPLQDGRPRILTSLEVLYLESLVQQRPDIYLSELRDHLQQVYNVEVNEITIS
ncbi:hypothetical protein BGY98DRAFT_926746 [Russula aff. rugulosa BPL654]|nr:hypothetical protein BGY98DRAFT_926746 [Russula aff. rugulosa BPL654]